MNSLIAPDLESTSFSNSEAVLTHVVEKLERLLDVFEVRVLAVLIEKEAITPDLYPMTLNGITSACNQLSSRDPVMQLTDETVQDVLNRLMDKKLVAQRHQAGARVAKYEHRARLEFALEQEKLVALTLLMLRGPQTAGEIRARSERMHKFDSIQNVDLALQFLSDKFPPLVSKLARAPGTKESRYAHLLSGTELLAQQEVANALGITTCYEPVRAQDRVSQLEDEVKALKQEVAWLIEEIGRFKQQFE